jgi:hypothetical protein
MADSADPRFGGAEPPRPPRSAAPGGHVRPPTCISTAGRTILHEGIDAAPGFNNPHTVTRPNAGNEKRVNVFS